MTGLESVPQPTSNSFGGESVIRISIKPTSSRTTTFIVLAFWGLLVYLAMQVFLLWFGNRTIIKWWQTGTGPSKQYNNCMSIWLLLAAGQKSKLLYWIISLFLPTLVGLPLPQTEFITGTLLKYVRLETPKGQEGIMLPRHMCVTVLLCREDGDSAFTAWMESNKTSRYQVVNDPNVSEYALTFTTDGTQRYGTDNTTPLYSYTATQIPGKIPGKQDGRFYGVYPAVDDLEGWRGCIQAWANGGLNSSEVKFAWTLDDQVYGLVPTNKFPDATLDDWFDTVKQPDNVFARYHLKPTSPLLTDFVSGLQTKPQGGAARPTAFKHLIQGGWIGFMENVGGDDTPEGRYEDMCFSKTYMKPNATPPNHACHNGWGDAALSGGIGGLGILAFLPGMAATGGAAAGAAAGAEAAAEAAAFTLGPAGWFVVGIAALMFLGIGAQAKMAPC